MKFLIVGGGICGLTTAIALHQKGFKVELYEATKEINTSGSGISLSSNAIRAFAAIGLYESIATKSMPQKGGRFFTPKGAVLNFTDFRPLEEKYGLPGLITIHRQDLHAILLECIKRDITISTFKQAKTVEQDEKGVTLHFTDGTAAKGDYLLACDGINSAIRKQFLPFIKPKYAGYTIWRGISNDADQQINLDVPFKTWGKKGQFGAVPMKNDQLYWFASFKAKPRDPNLKAITVEDLIKHFRDYHDPIPQILERTIEGSVILRDAEEMPTMEKYAFGRVLLMGDAAHAMTPNMGQGACQAIEDAVVLARLLQTETTVEKAFQVYEEQRMPRVQYATENSGRMGKVAHIGNGLLIAFRNFYMKRIATKAFDKQVEFLSGVQF